MLYTADQQPERLLWEEMQCVWATQLFPLRHAQVSTKVSTFSALTAVVKDIRFHSYVAR